MTQQDLEDIATSLLMRRNYIETGTVTLSANDAVASKQHKLIQPLDSSQKATIVRLESLAEEFLRAASKKSGVDNALAECAKWRMTYEEIEELLK